MEGSLLFEQVSRKMASKRKSLPPAKIRARVTLYMTLTCIVSASSGGLFGFDGGITGGVSTMPAFRDKFFPSGANSQQSSYYCKNDNQVLQLFASVMYFTGALASIPGALISKRFGRTMTMTLAGTSFVIGSAILAGAPRTAMLILGRMFWGVGVGFADQAATIYSAEMAPPHLRGTLTLLFQLCVVVGIFCAQAINIGTAQIQVWGWRLSLGLAAVPGLILLVGGLLLPETPNSLIERGYLQRGRAVLEAIRGTADVDAEYGTIVFAHRREKAAGDNQWKTMMKRELRPHLVMCIALPFFQQWTGINAVVFFSPFIFQGLGDRFRGETGALLASLIVGGVQVLGTIFGIFIVDRIGRRRILIQSSIQTFLAELVLGIVFAISVDAQTTVVSGVPAISSIVLICVFVAAFGYGWGPLAWIISSEIQPLETRSLGQGITVFVQLMSGAIVGQSFLSALCTLRYGVYIFFGVLQLIATVFVYFFLPETTGIPIEKVSEVFRVHWWWQRYSSKDVEGEAIQKELLEILEKRKEGKRHGRGRREAGTLASSESQSIPETSEYITDAPRTEPTAVSSVAEALQGRSRGQGPLSDSSSSLWQMARLEAPQDSAVGSHASSSGGEGSAELPAAESPEGGSPGSLVQRRSRHSPRGSTVLPSVEDEDH